MAGKPNVVFFMADDHAISTVGCYADRLKHLVHTPNIDQLAKDGMKFTQATVENAICSPGRAGHYSGRYTHSHMVFMLNKELNNPNVTWPKILDDAGYDTAVVGKWHLKNEPDTIFPGYSATVHDQGKWFNPKYSVKSRTGGDKEVQHPEGYTSDAYTSYALNWLDKVRDTSKPFALSLNFKAPHSHYEWPDRYSDLHTEVRDFANPETLLEEVLGCGASACESGSMITNKLYDHLYMKNYFRNFAKKDKRTPLVPDETGTATDVERGYEHFMLKVLRCVRAMDDNVGRVVRYLKENGLDKNTLVVYTSDQGYFMGEHGLSGKRTILEPTMRIPLIMRFPGRIKAGSESDCLSSNVDVAPTILDFMGVSKHPQFHGESLQPIAENGEKWDRDAQFFGYYQSTPHHYGIRTRDFTFARVGTGTNIKNEYYDRLKDPHQKRNVAEEPEYAEAIKNAETILDAKVSELGITPAYLPGGSAYKR